MYNPVTVNIVLSTYRCRNCIMFWLYCCI